MRTYRIFQLERAAFLMLITKKRGKTHSWVDGVHRHHGKGKLERFLKPV